ncbi:MAG: glycosyltransferase family 39 protein [Chloroflexi bacterium]|nr:glycosyltransferase family 39 protein [Chloroflexota bacterium]
MAGRSALERRAGSSIFRLAPGLALVALAFGLRVTTLTAQSLWNDEVSSLWHARFPLSAILAGLEPDHLPLYFLVLRGWVALAGSSEFALRFLSVLGSVLTVALLWWLGQRLGGTVVAAVAAFFGALSPAVLYYGQEARMYAWLAAFAVLAVGSMVVATCYPARRRWWAVHGLALALAAHLHYFGSLLFPVSWLLAGLAARRSRTWLRAWGLAQAGALASTVPYLAYRWAAATSYRSASAGDLSALDLLWRAGSGLLLGPHLERATLGLREGLATPEHLQTLQLLLPLGAMLLVGLWPGRTGGWPVLGVWLLVPFGLLVPVLVTGRDFTSRYLMIAAPAAWLLLGVGVARLGRWLRPLGLAAVLLPTLAALATYQDPAFARDDLRATARRLAAEATAGDVVLLNAGYLEKGFRYYFTGTVPVVALPATAPADDGLLAATTEEAVRGFQRAWLVLWQDYYSDPRGVVQRTLAERGILVTRWPFHGLQVLGYRVLSPFPPASAPPTRTTDLQFNGEVRLLGYDVLVDPPDPRERWTGVVSVRLYWQAQRPLSRSYRVFVQLVNPVYHVYAAKDNRPGEDRWPTPRWTPGQVVRDDYRLVVLPGTPPGEYQLSVGLYDEATGQRLPLDGTARTDALLGPVTVRQGGGQPDPSQRMDVRFGEGIVLLGYDCPAEARPGERLQLALHWRALATPPPDLKVFVHLVSPTGQLVAQRDSTPAAGGYPTERWVPGTYLRDWYDLDLPTTLAPGSYQLLVGLYRPDGERLLPSAGTPERAVVLTTLQVR